MSLWEYSAYVDGWNEAQSGTRKVEPPTSEEYEAMVKAHRDLGYDA